MRFLLICLLACIWPSLATAQTYVSFAERTIYEKQEFDGNLRGSGRSLNFSMVGAQSGINLTIGRRDVLRLNGTPVHAEVIWDAGIPSGPRELTDGRGWVRRLGLQSRAVTNRFGLGLRTHLGDAIGLRFTAGAELGVSHAKVSIRQADDWTHGRGTKPYAAVSLRAAGRGGLWADFRYAASPAMTIERGSTRLRHEINDLEFRVGFTKAFN